MKLQVNSAIIDRLDYILEVSEDDDDLKSKVSRDIVDRLDGIQKWLMTSSTDDDFLAQARSELEMDIEQFWRDSSSSMRPALTSDDGSYYTHYSLSFWNLYLDSNCANAKAGTDSRKNSLSLWTFWNSYLEGNSNGN